MLTPSQSAQLREAIKAGGIGNQGRSRSENDLHRAVHSVATLHQHLSLSLNQAINLTAKVEVATPRTIRSAVNQYVSSGTVTPTLTQHRGSGNVNHPFHDQERFTLEEELLLHRKIEQVKTSNAYESAETLKQALQSELSCSTSRSTVTRWLHDQGFVYGKKRFMGTMSASVKNQYMRVFTASYVLALREEKEGKAVCVYTDESYIHTQASTKRCWFNPSIVDGADVSAAAKGGYRLILIHAMTRDGMLSMLDEDAMPSNDLTDTQLTCEFVFRSAGVNDDYHTTIDGSKWIAWLNNRLIPTFKARYGDKKMILILDNAKYHHARPANWITPSAMKKADCISFLDHHGIDSITVQRDLQQRNIHKSDYHRYPPTGTSLVELKDAVKQHLSAHPEINTTLTQRAINREGYQLIHTPPYTPEVQPIELIWATVKHVVAMQATTGRSEATARQHTEAAFEQLSADSCLARIVHCQQWIAQWLRCEGAHHLQQYYDVNDMVCSLPLHAHGILCKCLPVPEIDVDD